jgi:aryl-alcohol dehydrogenase-like predicted oxidoreductase
MMEYRTLGRSGIKVSPICLGTMMFGQQTDDATAEKIVARAFEQGVNFLDTADVYNGGKSEEVVGRLLAPNRKHWILATKFGGMSNRATSVYGASRRHILDAVKGSLKRLATDYIDLIYIHQEDRVTPVAETIATIGNLISAGHIRYWGLSNHRAWRVAEYCATADKLNVPRPIASQPLYNLANRQIEIEHLTACEYFGLGVVPYSPLARGVLTAKYEPGATPDANTRMGRGDRRIQQTEYRAENLELAQEIKRHAQARGITASQFAFAWVLHNRLITSAIAGPRTLEQWEDYIPALDYKFTAEDEVLVDRFVATGHPSTPGYNDPGHPYQGRLPR